MSPRHPWWMCTGWWSPWCVLDMVARCKVRAICDRHDRASTREPLSEDEEFHQIIRNGGPRRSAYEN